MTTLVSELERPVPSAALARLRARLAGVALTPAEPGFTSACRIWNPAVPTRPRLVVRCTSGADVAAAVRFAREQALPVAVRGGGRHPAGYGTGPGVVLDLRPMARVRVDPLGGTVLVGGGASWSAVDAATAVAAGAVPGTPVGAAGVAGTTLGGGFGPLRRAYGLSCDNLLGADLVLADGTRTTTTGDEQPELLWGLRGGGGNFGVVTSLRFRLRPVPEPVTAATVVFPAAAAAAVLRCLRDAAPGLPETLSPRLSLYGTGHPAVSSRFPGCAAGPTAVLSAIGLDAAAAAALALLAGAATPLVTDLRPLPYGRAVAGGDDGFPAGDGAVSGSWFVSGLPDPLVAALAEPPAPMAGVRTELHVHQLGGAAGRVGSMSSAVPGRAAPYLVSALARWRGAAAADAARGWLAGTAGRLAPYAVGGPHPGFAPASATGMEVYGRDRYLRLAALKRRFDPDNVFAGNQNVRPLR